MPPAAILRFGQIVPEGLLTCLHGTVEVDFQKDVLHDGRRRFFLCTEGGKTKDGGKYGKNEFHFTDSFLIISRAVLMSCASLSLLASRSASLLVQTYGSFMMCSSIESSFSMRS